MAIYRPGTLAAAISGSIGGATFVNSRGSKVVRHRPPKLHKRQLTKPLVGTTPRNSLQRAIQGWQDLDQDTRTAWRTLATQITFPNRLGEARSLSGYNLYLNVNIRRAMSGLAILSVAPGTTRPQQIASMTLTADLVAGIEVSITWPSAQTPKSTLVYGGLQLGREIDAFQSSLLFLASGFFGKGVSVDLTNIFEARFGDLRVGTIVTIEIIPWERDTYPGTPSRKAVQVLSIP